MGAGSYREAAAPGVDANGTTNGTAPGPPSQQQPAHSVSGGAAAAAARAVARRAPPPALQFLRRLQELAGLRALGGSDALGTRVEQLAEYLCESALVDYSMLRHAPSRVAFAALWCARRALVTPPCRGAEWGGALAALSGCGERELLPCARDLTELVAGDPRSKSLHALFKKFSLQKFGEVAGVVLPAPP